MKTKELIYKNDVLSFFQTLPQLDSRFSLGWFDLQNSPFTKTGNLESTHLTLRNIFFHNFAAMRW